MKELDTCNEAGERFQMIYLNLFGNSIVIGLVYLAVGRNKVTF